MMKENELKPIFVTGLSGAGISSVLNVFEDFGFEVFDNFPVAMIPALLAESRGRIAVGLDSRTRGFYPDAVIQLAQETGAYVLFITCDDSVLQRRFTETRRRHPLARDKALSAGIEEEKNLLGSLRGRADFVLDTSQTSVHDVRHILQGQFDVRLQENLNVTFMSFGFKGGVPREADIVMDVRFLKNPHWDKILREKTGLEPEVGAYIRQDPDFSGFLSSFQLLLAPLLPRYATEGKSYLTIAIGCTGGKHRSVFVVETLRAWAELQNIKVFTVHRDLP